MKLFLIDGHALIFKMYYAFLSRPMINSKGEDMSILYGFTKYLLELIAREQPTHVAVAFDPPGGTFRNQLYPEYKANRTATPQLVIDALEPLTELCHSLNIPPSWYRGSRPMMLSDPWPNAPRERASMSIWSRPTRITGS